ncbi:chromate efflux transporter [Gimibacter soli]|uniref:Chromate efflux transporter n=1 Tax=Gimibacter soli TaxID=3024400 RepID=A0AAE9XU35_9PROT|nr:chromate efflux transporter [Gimibacter soli]WCL52704.1 chromate efflux transporter [Gimibacter soli]
MTTIPFGQALRFWTKLGFISFGGPAGQIAIMHDEVVTRRRWIDEAHFLHALNYCMLLPGPEAQQLATYLGWLMHGVKGGLAAGLLFILPSFFLLAGLAWAYMAFGSLPAVAALFYGLKPVVVAIIVHAALKMGRKTLATPFLACIAIAAFIALAVFHLPFPLVVGGAALAGWIAHRQDKAATTTTAATTEPAKSRKPRLLPVLSIGLLLWLVPMVLAVVMGGAGSTLTEMGLFFTKAAFLTFGGAYAVLPYVDQAAVSAHGWISRPQMMDGLALGEATPGPLIMVVTFVAFVGGFQSGEGPAAVSGWLAALIVTWVTFLPSFLFIFAGAPYVEATRHLPGIAKPLKAITAAVVGVIGSLALTLGQHTFLPDAKIDIAAMALAAIALWLMERQGWSAPRIVILGANAGAGLHLMA